MEKQTCSKAKLKNLPVKCCSSFFCPEQGPFTQKNIVSCGRPHNQKNVIGWCYNCKRYVCLGCAIWEEMKEQSFQEMDNTIELKQICLHHNKLPVTVRCHHCGQFLGKSEDILILI